MPASPRARRRTGRSRLSQLLDVPILLVHVSAAEAIEVIRNAQTKGLKIYGETCPQYLFLTADDIAKPGMEGAKFCCSPPPRDHAAQQAVWTGLRNGTFQVFSSDHAPYRFDASGKLPKGDKTTFKEIANGVPGIELRLPLLFSEGVGQGRLDLNAFVALTATNHAKLYGLYPRKGTIAVGSDADIAIWDADREVTVTAGLLHDNVGYTPYEGTPAARLADDGAEPRPGRRRERQPARRPGQRRFPPLCPVRRGEAIGNPGSGARLRRRNRRGAGVTGRLLEAISVAASATRCRRRSWPRPSPSCPRKRRRAPPRAAPLVRWKGPLVVELGAGCRAVDARRQALQVHITRQQRQLRNIERSLERHGAAGCR